MNTYTPTELLEMLRNHQITTAEYVKLSKQSARELAEDLSLIDTNPAWRVPK